MTTAVTEGKMGCGTNGGSFSLLSFILSLLSFLSLLFLLTPQCVIAFSFNSVAGFSAIFYATLSFVFVVCLLFSFFFVFDCTFSEKKEDET